MWNFLKKAARSGIGRFGELKEKKPKYWETDLARSEEQREDLVVDLKDRTTHVVAINLRDVAVKVAVGVGVEVRQIYSSGRRSHHPNDATQQKNPNPNTKTEKQGPSSLLPPERPTEGEGTSALTGRDIYGEGVGVVTASGVRKARWMQFGCWTRAWEEKLKRKWIWITTFLFNYFFSVEWGE
jgi:hypothetical protein